LERDITTEVLVIGAGYTGLSAALHLAQAGLRVTVLEAHHVGHGGSGRNVGLVNSGLWTAPDSLNDTLGAARGEALTAALAAAPDLVFDLIAQHGIACEARRDGTMHLAHTAHTLSELQARADQLARRGTPVEMLDRAQLAARLGSDHYAGALRDPRAGSLQPMGYARGLARAAQAAGAVIHETSPAQAITHHDGLWQAQTDRATIRAERLIRATNAYPTGSGAGAVPGHAPLHWVQAATAPLPPEWRARILAGGEGCWDTAMAMHSLRSDAAGRLILGGVGNPARPPSTAFCRGWIRRYARRLWPDLDLPSITHLWVGRIALTGDHLPRVEDLGAGGISIHGYGGRGIGPGTVFGRAAAQWAQGQADAFPLPITPPRAAPFAGLRGWGYDLGAAAMRVLGR
jgi:glycine/D-amino acid oxidase-like deaminating enzyme